MVMADIEQIRRSIEEQLKDRPKHPRPLVKVMADNEVYYSTFEPYNDPELMAPNVIVHAVVSVGSGVHNRIQFVNRENGKVGEIACIHTAFQTTNLETIQRTEQYEFAQSSERTGQEVVNGLHPVEHWVALNSYVAGIVDFGIKSILLASYFEKGYNPHGTFGFNSAMQSQLIRAIIAVAPLAACSIVGEILDFILNDQALKKHFHQFNNLISNWNILELAKLSDEILVASMELWGIRHLYGLVEDAVSNPSRLEYLYKYLTYEHKKRTAYSFKLPINTILKTDLEKVHVLILAIQKLFITNFVVDEVLKIDDDALRAYLVISAAKGLYVKAANGEWIRISDSNRVIQVIRRALEVDKSSVPVMRAIIYVVNNSAYKIPTDIYIDLLHSRKQIVLRCLASSRAPMEVRLAAYHKSTMRGRQVIVKDGALNFMMDIGRLTFTKEIDAKAKAAYESYTKVTEIKPTQNKKSVQVNKSSKIVEPTKPPKSIKKQVNRTNPSSATTLPEIDALIAEYQKQIVQLKKESKFSSVGYRERQIRLLQKRRAEKVNMLGELFE